MYYRSEIRSSVAFFLFVLSFGVAHNGAAQTTRSSKPISVLAATPPMDWNSWDAYGLTIDEDDFKRNVDVLSSLKEFGWQYAVIDEGWYMHNPQDHETPEKLKYETDANGRFVPVPHRFPSAINGTQNQGFSRIGKYVHDKGLKFGIHIIRGIPKKALTENSPVAGSRFTARDVADTASPCPWDPTSWGVKDNAAGQAWYDSLLRQYADWGVDYIKVDCVADHPYRAAEIRMIHKAIVRSGRPIILSLSPGPTSPSLAKDVAKYAQMWRISDDIWDDWIKPSGVGRGIRDQFALLAGWTQFATPGAWPDADMLPFGYLGPEPGEGKARKTLLSMDEQRSMLTLWAIAKSPLIMGANLTQLDADTRDLMENRVVLALDQYGRNQRQVAREGNVAAWTTHLNGKIYLALFNLADKPKSLQRRYSAYGLPDGIYAALDIWNKRQFEISESFNVTLAPHQCVLLELAPTTSASF